MIQRLHQCSPSCAVKCAERLLALLQPLINEGVNALLPVVLEQHIRLRLQGVARQKDIQRGFSAFQHGDIKIDAHQPDGIAAVIAQDRADRPQLAAIPIALQVGANHL
ncbi:hypothetical protein D3C75_640350 [compost metagenome]